MQTSVANKMGLPKKIIIYILLIAATAVFLFPILWIIISSFKPGSELFSWPPTILPKNPTTANYTTALEKGSFALYISNTFIAAIAATILTLVSSVTAGYVFAKYDFKGKNLIFAVILATLFIPLEVIMIPIYKVIVGVGFYDKLLGIIIPTIATPTGVFLVRQYYKGVPTDFMEAARIDGAGEMRTFLTVMLPMAKPVLSVLTIFSFMWRWNDYLWPKLVINTKSNYTLQLALATFSGEFSVDWNSLLAMSVIGMIPVLVVFLIFQKHIIGGLSVGGVKE